MIKKQTKEILLYSFDIDGTSNKSTHNLHIKEEEFGKSDELFPQKFTDALIYKKESNPKVNFMITTGRDIKQVVNLLKELPKLNDEVLFKYIGCVNGAFIYKWENNEYKLIKTHQGMTKSNANKVVEVLQSLNLPCYFNSKSKGGFYIKKAWNDDNIISNVNLKNWTSNHITYEEFYNLEINEVLSFVIDSYLIGRPPLNDSQKYIYSKEQIHLNQRNRFNDKYEFSQILKQLHRQNGVMKRTSVLVSGPNTIDISIITKADALKVVMNDLNLKREYVSHSGDNFNDLPAWKFLRSKSEQDSLKYGKKRGLVNVMTNTWDHLKIITGDKIVETNTVADFVYLSSHYDNIVNYLLWDKTNALGKEKRMKLLERLNTTYAEESINFEFLNIKNKKSLLDENINKENTMIIQINKPGAKTFNLEYKKYCKELQLNKRIAKMHVNVDNDFRI